MMFTRFLHSHFLLFGTASLLLSVALPIQPARADWDSPQETTSTQQQVAPQVINAPTTDANKFWTGQSSAQPQTMAQPIAQPIMPSQPVQPSSVSSIEQQEEAADKALKASPFGSVLSKLKFGTDSSVTTIVKTPLAIHMEKAGAKISSFESVARMDESNGIDVVETIKLDLGKLKARGFLRVLPAKSPDGSRTYQSSIYELTEVPGGAPKFTVDRKPDGTYIKIGEPGKKLEGVHTYKLHYKIPNVVSFTGGSPFIEWSVTGYKWPLAIQNCKFEFYPAKDIDISTCKPFCTFGHEKIRALATRISQYGFLQYTMANIEPGDDLLLKIDPLPLIPRFQVQQLMRGLAETGLSFPFWGWWPTIVLPIIAVVRCQTIINRRKIIVAATTGNPYEWNIPEGIGPAELGALLDETCPIKGIVATIIDLAQRGYVRMREVKSEKALFQSGRNFHFYLDNMPRRGDKTQTYEQEVLYALFRTDEERAIADLEGEFYRQAGAIRTRIYEALTAKGYLNGAPNEVHESVQHYGRLAMIAGGISFIGMVALGIATQIYYGNSFFLSLGPLLLGIAISGVVLQYFAPQFCAITEAGAKVAAEALKLRRFLEVGGRQAIVAMLKKSGQTFDDILPYALVMDLAEPLSDAVAFSVDGTPTWYQNEYLKPDEFNVKTWIKDLRKGLLSIGASLASERRATRRTTETSTDQL